jgi:hypothetical protein
MSPSARLLLASGAALSALLTVTLGAPLGAQAIITGPKAAAQRAVAATNANTNAQQSVTASSPSHAATAPTPSAPGAPRPVAAPVASAPSHIATAPLAATTAKTTGPTMVHTAPLTATTVAAKAKPAPAPLKPVAVLAKGKPAAAATSGSDTSARSISVTERGVKGEVSLSREVYSYDPGGRRDPFASLLKTGDLRPMLSDLRLVVVLYDPTGRNSIAIMRDVSTKDQYRVKVGQTVGRMRVAQIQPKEIVFTIEEVGFSRQEPLALGDSSTARTQ